MLRFSAANLRQAAACFSSAAFSFASFSSAAILSKVMAFSKYSANIFMARGARRPRSNYPLALPPKYDMLTGMLVKRLLCPEVPRVERPPGDLNARAVVIARIARGEIGDVTMDDGKNSAAVALGRMGG